MHLASIRTLLPLTVCLLVACATTPEGRGRGGRGRGRGDMAAVGRGETTAVGQRGRGGRGDPMAAGESDIVGCGHGYPADCMEGIQVRHYRFEETGVMLEYAVYVSSKVKKGTKAPLLIALHGRGVGPTSIMRRVRDLAERGGYIVAAPMGYNDHGWFGEFDNDRATPPKLREYSEKDVMNVLGFMRAEFDVDENRIYLMGQSMGSAGALFLSVKHSTIWAAVAMGASPIRSATHGHTIGGIPNIRHIPFILVHGDRDALVTVDVSRRLDVMMTSLGMTHEYHEIAGGSHPDAGRIGAPWMFEFFNRHRKSDTLAGAGLLAVPSDAAQSMKKTATPLPADLRSGTGTMEQIRTWMRAEKGSLPGSPASQATLPRREQDLDLDGINDLLIERIAGGSGGGEFSAFLTTPRGYRFIGTFYGDIRPLAVERGQCNRFIIGSAMGSSRAHVRLTELRADGLYQLATAILAAGDSGTVAGNRLYRDLMVADVVSSETLRHVFRCCQLATK